MKTETTFEVCPERIAEALGGFTLDGLYTLNCTITRLIDERMKQLKFDAKKAKASAVEIDRHLKKDGSAEGKIKPDLGLKLSQGEIQVACTGLEPQQLDFLASFVQSLAAKKRKAA